MIETTSLSEMLLTVLFCGSIACWLLKVDDTLPIIFAAGVTGVYFEPWISLQVGPQLFHYSVLSCLAGAVVAAFCLGLVQSVVRARRLNRRHSERLPHSIRLSSLSS